MLELPVLLNGMSINGGENPGRTTANEPHGFIKYLQEAFGCLRGKSVPRLQVGDAERICRPARTPLSGLIGDDLGV